MTPTIPNSGRPDNGLTFKHGSWYVRYYTGKIQRIKTLGTSDIVEARNMRDEFYLTLSGEGAVTNAKRGRPRTAPPEADASALPAGVTYRKPWNVTVDDVSIGRFHTLDEAMDAWKRATANEKSAGTDASEKTP